MSLSLEIADDVPRMRELAPAWAALVDATGDGPLLRGPSWADVWFKHYGPPFEAIPRVAVARAGAEVVGILPLYERMVRLGPGVRARELRLIGDAGPRPPALDLLVRPGHEEDVAEAFADWLAGASAPPWDVLDLAPLRDPSRARAFLAERLNALGRKVDSEEAGSTLSITLGAVAQAPALLPKPDAQAGVYASDKASLTKGLTALRRLSRLEWAARDEASPFADPLGSGMLEDLLAEHGASGRLRLARFVDQVGEVTAIALVVDDRDRAVCVALAVDPEQVAHATRLLGAEARAAALRGLKALDLVAGAAEIEPPPLPASVRRSLRLRAFASNTTGAVARTYARFRRRADAAREVPGAAAAGARAAWTRIRDAAASVAGAERLHLYRGELWTRGVNVPEGLATDELGEQKFDALPEAERHDLLHRLELDEGYARDKWRRGDLAVLATLKGRPVGVAWCARAAVMVPEIGREVRPGVSECYIHDVFVAPDARGRGVAPCMLEDLARRLRQRDVYRAWALIHPGNVASTRAFEKAAYASVADVVYTKVGPVDRLALRPPDSEGKKLLGIT